MGDSIGTTLGVIKGDTKSLDFSSFSLVDRVYGLFAFQKLTCSIDVGRRWNAVPCLLVKVHDALPQKLPPNVYANATAVP